MRGIILLCLVVLAFSSDLKIYWQENNTAKCLDGTPAAFFISEGTQKNKFVIYFQGGDLCVGITQQAMIQNCYLRSQTIQGSSSQFPEYLPFDNRTLISSNPINPFKQWTRVYVPYCDGSLHQGSKQEPIEYQGKKLYFRGADNTLALFKVLGEKFNFFSADNIILTGTSAGGMACLIWSNYVYQRALNPQGIVVVPDSAIFIQNFPNFLNITLNDFTSQLIRVVNKESKFPVSACVDKYPDQLDCFQMGNLAEFIKAKTFLLQSQYDSWGLKNLLYLKCVPEIYNVDLSRCNDAEMLYAESYRVKLNEGVRNFTKNPQNGAWSISCSKHGFIEQPEFANNRQWRVPGTWGITIIQAILSFISGKQRTFIDQVSWPWNFGCYAPQPNIIYSK